MIIEKKYLDFHKKERKVRAKTDMYFIHPRVDKNYPIGEIKWYSAWRRYCFFPYSDTLWDANCLGEIIAFINGLMVERANNKINSAK